MEEDGTVTAYYGGADGHFNPEGLYTGEGGEYHHDMEQPYDPSNFAEYSTNGHGTGVVEEYETHNEFGPLSSVLGDGGVGISALAFDTHEELLWMGNQAGHVTSYFGTQLSKYTSFQVNASEGVRALTTFDRGILALSQTSLRCQLRRGIPVMTHHSAHMMEMQCMLRYPQRPTQLLMGGIQDKMISFDLDKGKECQLLDTGGSCAVLKYHGRFVGCGDTSGKIHLRDPHNLNICHTLDTHTGTLSDFDMNGHYLVTCGFARRHGNLQAVDRFLMVYDLRILRSVNPIQCLVEPCQLRFLQGSDLSTDKIVVMSACGQVQLVDILDVDNTKLDVFQLDTQGGMTLSMDISPSNNCLAFGDENSAISVFSKTGGEQPVFNMCPRETEFPDPLPSFPLMDIDNPKAIYSSIPLPHLPADQNSYASDNWPVRFMKETYRPVPEINPQLLELMKVVGTIGYAPNNLNMKRNYIQEYFQNRGKEVQESDLHLDSKDSSAALKSSVPKRYKKTEIKIGKMGQDDFDFDQYNKTSFCGLEASLPNSYCNAMLQTLYFTEKLRVIILNHFCSRESCLACELSYLFHMLDSGHGFPCQPANFLRALRTIPETSALGLIFSEASSMSKANVPRLIQSWNRFILNQIHMQCTEKVERASSETKSEAVDIKSPGKNDDEGISADWSRSSPSKKVGEGPELSSDALHDMAAVLDRSAGAGDSSLLEPEENSLVGDLLGMQQQKITECGKCHNITQTENLLLLTNLVYPEYPTLKQTVSFSSVLCSSLCPEQTTPAWCEKCSKYQPTSHSRRLSSLPNTLSLNAGMDNSMDLTFWSTQMTLILEKHEGKPQQTPEEDIAEKQTPPPGQKACRYGLSCTRSDCKFWHPNQEHVKDPALDVGDQLAKINMSWVPFEVTLHLSDDGIVHSDEDIQGKDLNIKESRTYLLYAVCCNIVDPINPEATSLVSCINVGPSYHARIGSPVSQWYIFNDFTITPIPQQESVWFNLKWKIPCILFYQASTLPRSLENLEYENPITVDVFAEDKTVQRVGGKRITFTPLGQDEMPKKGDLIAIDAEFVTLNQEEAELRSDGRVSTVKAAHMSVARITCVRGEGGMEGAPFIDDYISTQEQVVDYLTKFSGIKPGDLDANFSSKHLTTLKSTYQKLRFLVDCGCIFIGHGLKNDFRVINILVPAEQTIDTLHLFHLPHHRWVSLKFLAWHFLKTSIQGVTHDSIEDAVTSLKLYRTYLQLKREGKVMEALTEMYELGKKLSWKVPE